MSPQFSELVHPVISYALDLKERLDNGDDPDLETEQRQLIDRLRSDGEVRRLSDYTGDGATFLGARYALTCWIDELFIVYSSWSDLWKERFSRSRSTAAGIEPGNSGTRPKSPCAGPTRPGSQLRRAPTPWKRSFSASCWDSAAGTWRTLPR